MTNPRDNAFPLMRLMDQYDYENGLSKQEYVAIEVYKSLIAAQPPVFASQATKYLQEQLLDMADIAVLAAEILIKKLP